MKLRASGRGAFYSPRQALVEGTLELVYRGGWPARAWAALGRAGRVELVERTLPLLAPGTPPLRLGFLSDVHLGPTTSPSTLDAAFGRLRAARPDVLLLGGDYVFLEATRDKARELVARIATIPARARLAVLGNHDLWTRHELLEEAFARAGITLLVNRSIRLPPPHEEVAVVGLDDPWTGRQEPDAAFAGPAEAARTRVVLAHAPEALPLLRGRGAHLLVCGHTHGGQLATPWGPLYVPGRWGRRYPAGFHRIDGVEVFVSRGVGGVEIPLRAYAPPDVALLTLVADPDRAGAAPRGA